MKMLEAMQPFSILTIQTGHYRVVAPTFLRQALAGEALTVFGDGTQSRCFGWMGDIVGALIVQSEHHLHRTERRYVCAASRIAGQFLAITLFEGGICINLG
jgi:nucleoside-diphosphate-sugar epimerase